MHVDPSFPRTPPPLPRPVVFDQRWTELTFLHWAVDPADVAPYLPSGTRPDVWSDGATYVGLVPFRMTHAGPGRLSVPYFGWFPETNIRLYSVDDEGRHGVVFRSLEASRLAVVLLARWGVRIPYTWARMRIERGEGAVRYRSTRRWPDRGPATSIAVRIGERVTPTPLEEFLTMRWGMHNDLSLRGRGRSTRWFPNAHEPWPLHEATIETLDDGLAAAAGFDLSARPDLRPLWSPGVRTQFGRPTRL
ncbi:YqjF family protein [Jatrophihabitans sp. YIM 134969]